MVGGVAAARKLAREVAWQAGEAPPVVARSWATAQDEDADVEHEAEGVDEPLAVDLDATLSVGALR